MKKNIISLLLIFLYCPFLSAQNNKVKLNWSETIGKKQPNLFCAAIAKDSSGFYTISKQRSENKSSNQNIFIFEKYDNNVQQLFSKELDLKNNNYELNYYQSRKIAGKSYLFTNYWDEKLKTEYILSNQLSENGILSGEQKNIFEMPEENAEVSDFSGYPEIGLLNSIDTTKILLYCELKEQKDKGKSVYCKALDTNLNSIWENTITLPYSYKNFYISQFIYDNNANLIIIGKVEVPRKERIKGEPSQYYTVLTYYYKTKEIKETKIELGSVYVSGIIIKTDKNQNIVVTGFYSPTSEYLARGVFYFKYNPAKKEVIINKTTPFTTELLNGLVGEKKGEELENYRIGELIMDDDLNAILIAEQSITHSFSSQTSSRYTYEYNDIICTKFSPEGTVTWCVSIPKLQKYISTDGGNYTYFVKDNLSSSYFSYVSGYKNGILHVVFNDHKKNITEVYPEKTHRLDNFKDIVPVLITIDRTGKTSKLQAFESKNEEEAILELNFTRRISMNQYLFFRSLSPLEFKLGKISF